MVKKKRSSYYSTEVIAANVLRNYLGDKCFYCNSKDNLHLHHKTPRVMGGRDTMSNIELVCMSCHIDLHKQLKNQFPHKPRGKGKIDEYMVMFGYMSSEN